MAAISFAGIGFAVLAAAALAGQSLFVRLSSKRHAITDIVAVMFVVNLLVLGPIAVANHYPDFSITPEAIGSFAIGGLLGSLVARFYLFLGIARLGASRAEPLKSTFPLISIGIAVVALNEALSAMQAVGVLLLMGGAVAITWEADASSMTATGRQLWVDMSYPLLAAVLLGVDPVISKFGLAHGTPPLVGVTIRIIAAASGFSLYLLWRRIRTGAGVQLVFDRWMLLSSGANTVYLGAYFIALSSAPVSVVTPIVGISPLLVILGAATFVQREERVTARLAVAVAVLVAGVVLILAS